MTRHLTGIIIDGRGRAGGRASAISERGNRETDPADSGIRALWLHDLVQRLVSCLLLSVFLIYNRIVSSGQLATFLHLMTEQVLQPNLEELMLDLLDVFEDTDPGVNIFSNMVIGGILSPLELARTR
jgi:hypothetical protein